MSLAPLQANSDNGCLPSLPLILSSRSYTGRGFARDKWLYNISKKGLLYKIHVPRPRRRGRKVTTTLFIVFREEKLPEGRAKKAKLAYMVLLFFLLVAWSAALIGEHLQFIAKIE